MFRLVVGLFKLLISWKVKVSVIGEENLPDRGPALLVFNHTDFLDTLAILFGVNRNMYGVVASNYARNPFVLLFWLIGSVIFVRRGKRDVYAQRKILGKLKKREIVAIAPEGTRSKTGALKLGKYGSAYFAHKSGSIVVPVAIVGSYGAYDKLLKGFLNGEKINIEVRVGAPFQLETSLDQNEVDITNPQVQAYYEQIVNEQIMPKIAELLPTEMHGVFSN